MKNDTGGLQPALAMYVVVLAAKLAAYYVTGVMALFAAPHVGYCFVQIEPAQAPVEDPRRAAAIPA